MVDAAEIIGSGSPGDYGLSPVEHAEQLKASAPDARRRGKHAEQVEADPAERFEARRR